MRPPDALSVLVLTATLFAASTPVTAQVPSTAAELVEHVLGESHQLKITAWVKNEASFGDDDWFEIEITNSGPLRTITSVTVEAPVQSNGAFNSSNVLRSLVVGIPSSVRANVSAGNTLPAGRYMTREPSVIAGSSLRLSAVSIDVTMRLSVALVLSDGRSISVSSSQPISFRWMSTSDAQMEALRRQAEALLQQASSGPSALSVQDFERMGELLSYPATASAATLELALMALKTEQVEHSFGFSTVLGLIDRRWRDDPMVTAFFRDALISPSRGPEALLELAVPDETPWDSSFVEPVVNLIEAAAGPFADPSWLVFDHGLRLMDRHYTSWSNDPSIAPRLSKAVMQSKPAEANGMFSWFYQVAQTHDLGMIAVLRPFLKDKTIDRFTSVSANTPAGRTPMRNKDLAADAIVRLLGEPSIFDPWERATANPRRPYPEWTEWDKKIAVLQRRLDDRGRK